MPDDSDLQERLETHVRVLASEIGERHLWRPAALAAAADYIEASWHQAGYRVNSHPYLVQGRRAANLSIELPGAAAAAEVVIVGAHYDTVPGTPGANDNGSGVAALLEIASFLAGSRPARTLRLVAFVNEEPPFFQTEEMGSFAYARDCRERREKIAAMFSLETIGFYSDRPGSQTFPFSPLRFLYPSTGNFLAFVANLPSRRLLQQSLAAFRRLSDFPVEGLTAPEGVPGVGWSDQWSFWRCGYPAVMVTDTALFRYPHYHQRSDTPEKLSFPHLARAVAGLAAMVGAVTDTGGRASQLSTFQEIRRR